MKINFLERIFKKTLRANPANNNSTSALSFDELNPLLAKQLSELESQIGQLAQVQFQLAEERQKMRFEMDALKKAVEDSQVPLNQNPINEVR